MYNIIPIQSFIPVIAVLFCGAITRVELIHLVINKLLLMNDLNKYNKVLSSYFLFLFLFAFINMMYSLFGVANFISHNDYRIFFYFISVAHVSVFTIIGIFRNGICKFVQSFSIDCGSGLYFLPIKLLIFCINVLFTFLVEPFVIATRLVLNDYINHVFHDVLSNMFGSTVTIPLITLFKILIVVIQSYVYTKLMVNVFKHLYLYHNNDNNDHINEI